VSKGIAILLRMNKRIATRTIGDEQNERKKKRNSNYW
jgi:hypothetical protein